MGILANPAKQARLTALLAWTAVGCFASSLVAHSWATWDGLSDTHAALFARFLPAGAWRFVAFATVGLSVAAVATAIAARFGKRSEPTKTRVLEDLSTEGIRQALDEVRVRAEATLTGNQDLDVGLGLDELLQGALRVQASDIHMSPSASHFLVTYRVQGTLHEVIRLAPELGPRLATRLKVLARMNTYSREPQDGRLRHQVGEFPLEARVSVLPADYGERLVLRLVRGTLRVPDLAQLGFSPETERALQTILTKPQGMLFVSGPVGSGKTTTLYSALQHISTSRGSMTSLVTLEDPIELELPFATQTQINTRMGMSFAQTLRSVLRQDPNVLMLGEVRDRETAEIATQAGLTGHLILTTIHVDSAAGTFARLIEMGVEPFVVASATAGCLSQRLVRHLCTHCRQLAEPEPAVIARFNQLGVDIGGGPYFEPGGCPRCEGQGYQGRQPVAELLVLTPALRQAVHERQSTNELQRIARDEGMVPLVDVALDRARNGLTSLSEILRVLG